MSTTTAVVRAAIAYVKPGPPATLGRRHEALEETVCRYVLRKQQEGDAEETSDANSESGGPVEPLGSLPETSTRAFAKERGVRLLVRSKIERRGKAKRNG